MGLCIWGLLPKDGSEGSYLGEVSRHKNKKVLLYEWSIAIGRTSIPFVSLSYIVIFLGDLLYTSSVLVGLLSNKIP